MGTLSSELGHLLDQHGTRPRVYADANVPAGLVAYMRQALGWDVFFVIEHDDLRRAPDTDHYRLALQLHRTLVTLDRDYFDDRRFPPAQGAGVIVVSAPDERLMGQVLGRIDRHVFGRAGAEGGHARRDPLPLRGRKLHAHVDWSLPEERPRTSRRRRRDRKKS